MTTSKSSLPTTFVVLGVTGDLMAKKIAPAFFNLHEKGIVAGEFRLVGVSRRDWTDDDLKRAHPGDSRSKGKGCSIQSRWNLS